MEANFEALKENILRKMRFSDGGPSVADWCYLKRSISTLPQDDQILCWSEINLYASMLLTGRECLTSGVKENADLLEERSMNEMLGLVV